MNSRILKIAIFITTLAFGAMSYAGGCIEIHPTFAKKLASLYMARLVRNKLQSVEKKMNAKGEKLNVVFVARRGENMNGLRVYKDDPRVPLEQYLYELDHAIQMFEQQNPNSSLPSRLFSKRHLIYSHMGMLVRTDPAYHFKNPPKHHWVFVTHLLAVCDKKSNRYGLSDIYHQTFDRFFWDTKVLKSNDDSALLIVPSPAIQARLIKILANPKIVKAIHTSKYNVAAAPFRFRPPNDRKKPDPFFLHYQVNDQNSDQWPLELVAASELPAGTTIVNRVPSQDVLWKTNYRPTLIRATGFFDSVACSLRRGPILPWGGNLWDASNLINCFDQVFRGENIYQLVTVRSVVKYLERNHLMSDNVDKPGTPGVYEIKADPNMIKGYIEDGKLLKKAFRMTNRLPDQQQ